jgi:hypothetical protein
MSYAPLSTLKNHHSFGANIGNYPFDIGIAMCCVLRVSADSAAEAGAPEDNVEITMAMIKAGTMAYVTYDPRFEDVEDVVPRVYRAMEKSRLLVLVGRQEG